MFNTDFIFSIRKKFIWGVEVTVQSLHQKFTTAVIAKKVIFMALIIAKIT